jgi:hypothetical protein
LQNKIKPQSDKSCRTAQQRCPLRAHRSKSILVTANAFIQRSTMLAHAISFATPDAKPVQSELQESQSKHFANNSFKPNLLRYTGNMAD